VILIFGALWDTIIETIIANATQGGGGFLLVLMGLIKFAFYAGGCTFLILGVMKSFGRETKERHGTGQITAVDNVCISAKNVIHIDSEAPCHEPDVFEDDELEWNVRIIFPNGKSHEYATDRRVYDSVGEGLKGRILVDGPRLISFEWEGPPESAQESDVLPDPFVRNNDDLL
jgi:hypothetical protein